MGVSRTEIEERWLGNLLQDNEAGPIVECFNRVEEILGRPWLESSVAPGVVGPAQMLPIYRLGDQLNALAGATGGDKLIRRLRAREPASWTELHSIALCAEDGNVEIEVEPPVRVGASAKVPDFRVRRSGEEWVWVEVTQPGYSESARIAQNTAASLEDLLAEIPDGTEVQVRFRCEPSHEDLDDVRVEARNAGLDQTIDRPNFIIHTRAATPVLTPIDGDEQGRPIFGIARFRVRGETRALLSVRVPYTDLRGQQVIDAEACQLPKEGPGLICVATGHGKYWTSLIERSFSPAIRRRISGVLLFQSGLLAGNHGTELQTAGRLISNPYARRPLPSWLQASLHRLPEAFRHAGARE